MKPLKIKRVCSECHTRFCLSDQQTRLLRQTLALTGRCPGCKAGFTVRLLRAAARPRPASAPRPQEPSRPPFPLLDGPAVGERAVAPVLMPRPLPASTGPGEPTYRPDDGPGGSPNRPRTKTKILVNAILAVVGVIGLGILLMS